ncbi:MAG: hypothetical protein ABIA74_05220 [bacterium]
MRKYLLFFLFSLSLLQTVAGQEDLSLNTKGLYLFLKNEQDVKNYEKAKIFPFPLHYAAGQNWLNVILELVFNFKAKINVKLPFLNIDSKNISKFCKKKESFNLLNNLDINYVRISSFLGLFTYNDLDIDSFRKCLTQHQKDVLQPLINNLNNSIKNDFSQQETGTKLHWAVLTGDLKIIQKTLDKEICNNAGVDDVAKVEDNAKKILVEAILNFKDDVLDLTILHWATLSFHPETFLFNMS